MMKLEKMDDFFAARIDGYDEHMKRDIEGASGFYAYTASLLPLAGGSRVLDLGCGTGLELEEYFVLNPGAAVTGIDLSEAMLNVLKAKFPDKGFPILTRRLEAGSMMPPYPWNRCTIFRRKEKRRCTKSCIRHWRKKASLC